MDTSKISAKIVVKRKKNGLANVEIKFSDLHPTTAAILAYGLKSSKIGALRNAGDTLNRDIINAFLPAED